MRQKFTPYLQDLFWSAAIEAQYVVKAEDKADMLRDDPLREDEHEVVKGLIHKYENRALIKVSYQCAAHCRFCTRIRQIGEARGRLTVEDAGSIISYLKVHPEVEEVILSGGDPMVTPRMTIHLLEALRDLESIRVIRIGTRLPLQHPGAFRSTSLRKLLACMEETGMYKPLYLLLHVEHPDELTAPAVSCIRMLRNLPMGLLSQTVFLKGINDDEDILYHLFRQLHHLGVMPYYLFHCDAVRGLERFCGDVGREKQIAGSLRKRLSGIACPLYILDSAEGKRPV